MDALTSKIVNFDALVVFTTKNVCDVGYGIIFIKE